MIRDERPPGLRRIDRLSFWQRAALAAEGLWQAAQWPLVVLLVGLALAASGVLRLVPDMLRLGAVVALLALFLAALWPALRFRLPSRRAALRHLEQQSGVAHRSASAATDTLAPELEVPAAERLWEEHKRRQLAAVEGLKVVPPRSHWRQFDPHALRLPAVLAAVAALVLGQGSLGTNLREAVRVLPALPAQSLAMDAWLKPPAYTGRPPLLLTSPVIAEKLARGEDITIPDNSQFTLRVSGASAPAVALLNPVDDAPVTDITWFQVVKDGVLTASADVSRPLVIVVTGGGRELARWPISPVPDSPPTISLVGGPKHDGAGKLTLNWKASDDIGVTSISGSLDLADEQDSGVGFESNGIFLYDAPDVKFSLRRPNTKEENGRTTLDLASHPWAGLKVTLNLAVKDAAGQEGRLAPTTLTLPERVFVKPLPRAIIELRKQVIFYPDRAGHVANLLDAAMLYPRGLFEGSGPVIAVGTIVSRLRNARGYDDVKEAVGEMWKVAVLLEDGAMSNPKAELAALKAELEKALREGAPEERIAELMDRMRKAMDKLMDAMREEGERRQQDGSLPQTPQDGSKTVTREDLQRMMDELEKMSKSGAGDMAQQMLDQLDKLLQNLQPGAGQQAGGEGQGAGDGMMQGLNELMRKQRGLMDDTQRMPGESGEGLGDDPGQQGQGEQGPNGQGGGRLAQRQQDLQRQLDEMRSQGNGRLPGELDGASKDMEGAGEALRDNDKEGALRKQGEAMEKMRRGAQALLRQNRLLGDNSPKASSGAPGANDDPLGRPRATRGADTGPDDDIVPSEQAVRRAREILEQLRNKANDRALTDSEKAYIDRLLRGLY